MSESEAVANPIPNGAIVVGVDGSDAADRAAAWAVRYAAREEQPLVIAHAFGALSTPEAAGLHFDGGATLLLGSVTSAVAGRAGCPVVVIPPNDDSDGEPPSRATA